MFDLVVRELRLAPPDLPDDDTTRRWAMVRWFAQLVVDGDLDAGRGGRLIWQHSGHLPADRMESLGPLLASIVCHDDELGSWSIWDSDHMSRACVGVADVVREASVFLEQA